MTATHPGRTDSLAGTRTGAFSHGPAARVSSDRALNLIVARRLDETARLLEEQRANPFRVQAYRTAASSVRRFPQPIDAVVRSGTLEDVPGVGPAIAHAIQELVLHGRFPMLERLRGKSDPTAVLSSVPGVGATLAARIHHELGIGTLEDLETAAHDGRLAALPGIGPRRIAAIADTLAARLARRRPLTETLAEEPTVAELLDVDREYCSKAQAGELRTITPRRFNPEHQAWLPVLHTTRGSRHYSALFSNTARAHQLGRTKDWVVLYWDADTGVERQCTIITSGRGPLAGKRIVRGREAECLDHYGAGEGTFEG